MIVDFGETFYSDNYEVHDTDGVLANAGTVTATITLPDGTTTAATVTNPSVGIYNFKYTTTQAGLHIILTSGTGGILGSDVLRWNGSFYVASAGAGSIISFESALAHLNIPGTTTVHNEELRPFMLTATEVVEFFCGPCLRRTVTKEVRGGSSVITLPHSNVLSLTSLTPILTSAPTVTIGDLHVSTEKGRLYHKAELPISWGPLTAVYVVGRAVIPWSLQDAAKEITKHLWNTQRGPGGRPAVLGSTSSAGGETTFLPVFGFAIPNKAMDLMNISADPAGVMFGVA